MMGGSCHGETRNLTVSIKSVKIRGNKGGVLGWEKRMAGKGKHRKGLHRPFFCWCTEGKKDKYGAPRAVPPRDSDHD